MKEREELMANADASTTESPNRETTSFVETTSTEPATVQGEAMFPDPATEDEEIEGEIDTNTEIAKQASQEPSSFESSFLLSLERRRTPFLKKRNFSEC